MRMYPREFPSGRRRKPKRQAERRVYEALAGSDRRGFCYYEWRRGYGHIELDFAVWIEGLGRFALQVKGGRYLLVDGEWRLKTRDGVRLVESCPLDDTKLAALDLHDDIKELAATHYNPYVIPVLMFPDMAPDGAIKQLAKRTGVYVIWGVRNLLADLAEIVRNRGVHQLLTAARIADEVFAVTDGLIRLSQAGGGAAAGGDEPAGSVSGRNLPGVLRLMVGGTTVITIRSNAVRCRAVKRNPTERNPTGRKLER